MKILNIDEEGRYGGPERRIVNIASILKRYGIHTTVVIPQMDSTYFQDACISKNVRYEILDLTRLTLDKKILFKYIIRFPKEIYLLIKYIRKFNFNVVHINGSYQFKSALSAWLAGSTVIWHLNDTYAHPLVLIAFKCVNKICKPTHIIAGKRVGVYYLNEDEQSKAIEIHAPVDTDQFYPKKRILDTNTNAVVISTVTSSAPSKGLDVFIETAHRIWLQNPNVKFHVACPIRVSGEQFYKNCLKRLKYLNTKAQKNVSIEFFGFVESVPEFLRHSDVFLYTSRTEASPTAVWEAMATGLPVVTTDVGSVKQHIRDGVEGYVCPVNDVEALSAAVLSIIDVNNFENFGKRTRAKALETLSLEKAAKLHADIYIELANG